MAKRNSSSSRGSGPRKPPAKPAKVSNVPEESLPEVLEINVHEIGDVKKVSCVHQTEAKERKHRIVEKDYDKMTKEQRQIYDDFVEMVVSLM